MDRLSNALTLFGVVLIVGGVAVMVVAVVWLRREQAQARIEASQARSRPPAQRLEIRRSALLAETVPLPAVPMPGAMTGGPGDYPLSLATQAAGPAPSLPRLAAAPRPARSSTRSRPQQAPPNQGPPPPSGSSNSGAWPANGAPTPHAAPSSTTAPSTNAPLANAAPGQAQPARRRTDAAAPAQPGPNAGPVTGPGMTVRRGPWPPAPARHPIVDPSHRPH